MQELKEQGAEFFIDTVFPVCMPLLMVSGSSGTINMKLLTLQHFLSRYKTLLAAALREPSSPEGQELQEIVRLRRMEENRVAIFSQWTRAVLAWNKEEMATQSLQPPTQQFWSRLLVWFLSMVHFQIIFAQDLVSNAVYLSGRRRWN